MCQARWLTALGLAMAMALSAWAGEEKAKEEKVTLDQLPAAVKETLLKEVKDGKITEIERETKGEVVTYEADAVIGGKKREITVAADGKLISNKPDDDHDDDDDVTVTLDQVPAAVKATIEKAAQGGKITEIEREGEGDKAVYEAEVVIEGKEYEIKVAADGKLISKKLDTDEDDDDDKK
jgi:uncharacterized membrane protein YkoI